MKKVMLKEIGKIVTGCTPLTKIKEYYNEKKYMFVGPSDIKNVMYVISSEKNISEKALNDYKDRFISQNSIVVDCIGSDMGNVAIVKNKCLTNQQINAITNIDEREFNVKYIYYVLFTMKKHFHLIGTNGSTMPIINKSMFENIEIGIQDIKTQNKISNILSKLDDKIILNNEINNNLYEIIKNTYLKFQNEMQDYNTVKLSDISTITSGKRPKTKGDEYSIPLIGANGVMSNTNEYNSCDDVIVIGRVGTLGEVKRYFDKVWLSDNTINLKTKYSNILENYLMFIDYNSLNRGSTQPLITQTDIKKLEIKFNEKEFIEFENKTQILRNKIIENDKENKILIELRDTLLPKLMNGEINLENIEI